MSKCERPLADGCAIEATDAFNNGDDPATADVVLEGHVGTLFGMRLVTDAYNLSLDCKFIPDNSFLFVAVKDGKIAGGASLKVVQREKGLRKIALTQGQAVVSTKEN